MAERAEAPLARERERFLNSGAPPARVRPEVSSSWRRCLSWSVPADGLEPPYRPDLDRESRLLRAAVPVLDSITDRLGEIGISFIVTDADARILDRRVRERRLLRTLDARKVHPGFVFAEDAVGTNGLGTAVELGCTVRVDGHEHYATDLTPFTCVGVPIHDPISRRCLGILDVTCAADHDNTLVTLIAEQTARAIQSRLVEQHSLVERALLTRFLATSRRSHGAVIVLNERIVMTNPQAARALDGVDQSLLWDGAARAAGSGGAVEADLPLADGRSARTRTTAVCDGDEVIGAVVEIRAPAERSAPRLCRTRPAAAPPGLVGADPAFLEARRAADELAEDRVLVLYGEPGVGKSTLARALNRGPAAVSELDVAAAALDGEADWFDLVRTVLAGPPGALIVHHADLLSTAGDRALAAVLATGNARGWRCTVTASVSTGGTGPLVSLDHERVWLPPLRSRLADLPALVGAFAAPRRMASEVIQLLQRLSWPGNVRELRSVVQRILAATPPGGLAGLAQVPPEVRRAAPRRRLTRFERAELHAIIEALTETGGNKKDAAALLGISRSTLYRKLQTAGIDLENTVY